MPTAGKRPVDVTIELDIQAEQDYTMDKFIRIIIIDLKKYMLHNCSILHSMDGWICNNSSNDMTHRQELKLKGLLILDVKNTSG